MRTTMVETLTALLDEKPDVALVLAEISVGLFDEAGVTRRHRSRVINVGIREQLLIGVAAGMAKEGFRPFVHTYAPFLVERPFEQVKLDLGHQSLGAVLVSIGASRDAAAAGRTHQAPEDVALIATLPDWTVFVPGHAREAAKILRVAADLPGPAYVRLTETANRAPVDAEPGWSVIEDGDAGGVTVVVVGPMLDPTRRALEIISAALAGGRDGAGPAGQRPTVIYTNRPFPVDAPFLRQHVTGQDIIIIEPYLEGTTTGAVAAALPERPMRYLAIGFPHEESRRYGTPREHFIGAGLDAAGIAKRIEVFIGQHR